MPRWASWHIFVLVHHLSPQQVREQYRRRFGIESSYRCAAQVGGWTTSKNAACRFVLMGLSFLLLNVWIRLRWCFIVRALEQDYECVYSMRATVPPRRWQLDLPSLGCQRAHTTA
jgi:IS4 transposase